MSKFEISNLAFFEPALIAEEMLYPGSKMMNEIAGKNDFKYDSGSGIDVYLKLSAARKPITVGVYRSKNPWSKAVGYFDGKGIYINTRKKLLRDEIVGLFLHEYAHYCGFSHGNNFKTKEKCLYSVPYWLSENVSKWL